VIDAIRGLKKTVELNDGTSLKKISVTIPAGVRSGSVIRFRRRENTSEEIVIIIRVAAHPFLSIAPKGLIIEVPITVKEAVLGARIKVPTLDEPSTVFIEPGTQSGTEVRLRGQGIQYRDGAKGDLFVRVMVRVPATHGAVGLAEKCGELEMYYEKSVREALPHSILEM
jgi:DnaJ-class molecular chaperone